jgi:hypothetical protein
VTHQTGRSAWTALHLLYPSAAARLTLVTGPLRELSERCPAWFFVDLPFNAQGGLRQGLEIAVQQRSGESADVALQQMLHRGATAGLVLAAEPAAAPALLQPALFPGSVVCTAYAGALTIGSNRAVERLIALGSAGDTPDLLVEAELAAGYHALFPRVAARRTALLFHASWLEAIAGDGNGPSAIAGATATADEQSVPDWPARGATVRQALLRHARRTATRLTASGDAVTPADVLAMLAARLLHIHVVRLWGPEGRRNALCSEAAVLRGLAASLESVSGATAAS